MVQIGFKCSRGVVRKNNEDACFVIPSHNVYIVADGVGGNNSGEVASRTAVSEIAGYVAENDISACKETEEIFGFLSEAIRVANEKVYQAGMDAEENRGMATTVVMAYIKGKKAYVVNIGDSRAYLFRNGKLKRITNDHTYVNELIKKGVITEDEAEHHQQKNVITKALGAEYYVDPDFYQVKLKEDDVLMLCSDGLYGEVKEKEIAQYIRETDSMNELCSELVDKAIKSGGRDNITVVCLRI
ncbi:MAG: Stp1/IreP family PP2C-type Ser/Thr phosphatase [Clostridiales bacterium]|nr:Stp1/IreP family PP2C-type Ser/Thr phosphatase [Clostridiales bacterium]